MDQQQQTIVDELGKLLGGTNITAWSHPADGPENLRKTTELLNTLRQKAGPNDSDVVKFEGLLAKRQVLIPSPPVGTPMPRAATTPPTTQPPVPSAHSGEPRTSSDQPPVDQAVAQILRVEGGRFRFNPTRDKLQTGRYSTGYRATDATTKASVIVKIPADDKWPQEFALCADALRAEAALVQKLPQPLRNADLPNRTLARIVSHVADGEVSISVPPYHVPWAVQSFARGRRVSDMLPMRGANEGIAIQILAQVTGMVRTLYGQGSAHRDLKVDCLFWDNDAGLVEVIDWNRATNAVSDADKVQEFAAIQRLSRDLLLGPYFQWTKEGVSTFHDLLVTFDGTTLSRGTRLLLWRLWDPAAPESLRTVEDLDTALAELSAFWQAPLTEAPGLPEASAKAHAERLNRLAVEALRPLETQAYPATRSRWYDQAMSEAIRAIQNELRAWIVVPATLRPRFARLPIGQHLADVWLMPWFIPAMRAWFDTRPSSEDARVVVLIEHLAAGRWEAAQAHLTELRSAASEPLRSALQDLGAALGAYVDLGTIEQLPPNTSDLRQQIEAVRAVIPQEPRVWRVIERVAATEVTGVQITTLISRREDLRRQRPSVASQRERLAVMLELQRLGFPSSATDLAEQQAVVNQLTDLEANFYTATSQFQQRDWTALAQTLQATLQAVKRDGLDQRAVDLDEQIRNLIKAFAFEKAADSVSQATTAALALVEEGNFDAARKCIEEAREKAKDFAPLITPCDTFLAAESSLRSIWQVLDKAMYPQASKITLTPPPWLRDTYQDVQRLARLGAEFAGATTFEAVQHSQAAIAADRRRLSGRAPLRQQWWDRLDTQARDKLGELLNNELNRAALKQDLSPYKALLDRLVAESGTPPDTLQQAQSQLHAKEVQQLRQGQEAVVEQLKQQSDALNERMKQLAGETQAAIIAQVDKRVQPLGTAIKQVEQQVQQTGTATQGEQQRIRQATESTQGEQQRIRQATESTQATIAQVEQRLQKLQGMPDTIQRQLKEANLTANPQRIDTGVVSAIAPKLEELGKQLFEIKQLLASMRSATAAVVPTDDRGPKGPTRSTNNGTAIQATDPPAKPGFQMQLSPQQLGLWVAVVVAIVVVIGGARFAIQQVSKPQPKIEPTSIAGVPTDSVAPPTVPPLAATGVVAPTVVAPTVVAPTTPAGASTAPVAATAVTPDPNQITMNLGQELVLSNIESPAAITVVNATLRAQVFDLVATVSTTAERQLLVTIPPTLLAQVNVDFGLPTNFSLDLGSGGQPITAVMPQQEVTVRGVKTDDKTLETSKDVLSITFTKRNLTPGYVIGAPLWDTPNPDPFARVEATNAITLPNGYVLLSTSDRVTILAGNKEYYKIKVVTNRLDGANAIGTNAIGKEGWVRKVIIDGP